MSVSELAEQAGVAASYIYTNAGESQGSHFDKIVRIANVPGLDLCELAASVRMNGTVGADEIDEASRQISVKSFSESAGMCANRPREVPVDQPSWNPQESFERTCNQ